MSHELDTSVGMMMGGGGGGGDKKCIPPYEDFEGPFLDCGIGNISQKSARYSM